jgi:hypothetical protein
VTSQHLARRIATPADRRLPVDVARREIDLREHEVDDAVDDRLLVRDVVVDGHRLHVEMCRELADRERLDPDRVREFECTGQHTIRGQRLATLTSLFGRALGGGHRSRPPG